MRAALLSLFFLSASVAAAPTIADFNHSMPLQTKGNAARFQITVPSTVYLHSQRADLGDMRVFNAAGELLPYALRQPEIHKTTAQTYDLPFFPLNQQQNTNGSTTQIKRNADGSLVNITQQAQQKDVVSHLLDASRIKVPYNKLIFAWENTEFSAPVVAQASDDLQSWHEIGRGEVMSLQYQGQALTQQTLELPASSAKYLRLQWPDTAPQLHSVQVSVVPAQSPAPRTWQRMNIVKTENGSYFFNTPIATPLEQLRVSLPQVNTLARSSLWSRSKKDAAWQMRWQGVLYRLARGQTELNNTPALFTPNSDIEWKLQVDTQGGGVGAGIPSIEMAWSPSTLLFIARGNPPFTLAYGNKLLKSAAQSENDLLIEKTSPIGIATAGTAIDNPNPPSESDPAQQKKWLLWGALLLAVGVLGLMARSLLRQMKPK